MVNKIYFGDRDIFDRIILLDDYEIYVHRTILAFKSNVFKAMFYGPYVERDQEKVRVKDVDAISLLRILDLIYDGKISKERELPPLDHNNTMGKMAGNYCRTSDLSRNEVFYRRDYVDYDDDFDSFDRQKPQKKVEAELPIDSQLKDHIFDFWNARCNLLTVADLYNVKEMTLNHLEATDSKELQTSRCRHECLDCLALSMFFIHQRLAAPQRKFSKHCFNHWFKIMNYQGETQLATGDTVTLDQNFFRMFMNLLV